MCTYRCIFSALPVIVVVTAAVEGEFSISGPAQVFLYEIIKANLFTQALCIIFIHLFQVLVAYKL